MVTENRFFRQKEALVWKFLSVAKSYMLWGTVPRRFTDKVNL